MVPDAVLCGFVLQQQQLNFDVKPWHSGEMLANHNKFDTSFLEFGSPLPGNAAVPCLLHEPLENSACFLGQAQPQYRHIHQQ